MVAHVLRLRLALMFGALRGDRRRVSRTAIELIVLLVATAATVAAVLSLQTATSGTATTVIIVGGALFMLGFFLAPILAGTVDQLDPRRFAVFGLSLRGLPWVLALAALISMPTLALAAVIIAVGIVASAFGAPLVLAVLGGVLALITAVLAARIGMLLIALALPERRSRELTALFTLALVVVAVPVGVFVASMSWNGDVPPALETAASVLSYTPFGAAFALPFAAVAEEWDAVWVIGVIAVVTTGLLAALWGWLVRRALTTTGRRAASRERPGLGWFALLPSTPFGAIAARSLVYWLRDRRYLVNVAIVPIAGVLSAVPLLVAGVPLTYAAALPVAVMALFFGWLPHNDIAYDSTAFWTHVVSDVRGIADRLGRLVPIALISLPILAVAVPLTLAVIGRWSLLPVFIGLTMSLLLSGFGLSSIASVVAPYAVSRPGDSPFQQPQRATSRGAFGQAGALIGAVAVSAPTIWLAWLALSDPTASVQVPLWVGLGTGILVLAVGVLVGARFYERREERVMEFIETV
ncbi:hypothetical protein GCM10017596_17380 [Microbacterium keratanolyticum]|uniref:ABC-2 type transport system permease protein n=2 Tax=Microbacterium keratanolyticum TaxID=67574 RepID=A0A9W6HSD5_9MICO|nr:hypothetical protein GCM10017596_17380 [Microbacterium keratanolyticum]